MPIPPGRILTVRLFGVWFWGTVYVAIVFLPALAAGWVFGAVSVAAVVCGVLALIAISFFVLTLSCILGWVVAKVSAHLRHKSLITVAISLLFFGVYYYFCFRANAGLQLLITNAGAIGQRVRSAAWLLYQLGRAASGEWLPVLGTVAVVAVLFHIVFRVLSHSFLRIATTKQASAKRRYQEKAARVRTPQAALLSKEARRLLSSPVYLLNCCFGTLFLLVAVAAVLWKGALLRAMFSQLGIEPLRLPVLCALLCLMTTMNDLTAPSVSLEGQTLWIAQSLPVTGWQALRAKLTLHLLVTLVPALLCALCAAFVLRLPPVETALLVAVGALFILLCAAGGLAVNLKMPNLHWRSEAVAVKQSGSVMVALFGGRIVVAALAVGFFALRKLMPVTGYVALCALVLAAANAAALAWLYRRVARIFSALG